MRGVSLRSYCVIWVCPKNFLFPQVLPDKNTKGCVNVSRQTPTLCSAGSALAAVRLMLISSQSQRAPGRKSPWIQMQSPMKLLKQTKRNKPMLVGSYGFCYSRIIDKRYKGSKTTWKCTVRPSTAPYKAVAVKDRISWTAGTHTYNHLAQPGRDQYIKTVTEVKQKASTDLDVDVDHQPVAKSTREEEPMDTDAVNNIAVSPITFLPSSKASQYQLPANSSFDVSMSFRTVCNKLEDTANSTTTSEHP